MKPRYKKRTKIIKSESKILFEDIRAWYWENEWRPLIYSTHAIETSRYIYSPDGDHEGLMLKKGGIKQWGYAFILHDYPSNDIISILQTRVLECAVGFGKYDVVISWGKGWQTFEVGFDDFVLAKSTYDLRPFLKTHK